MFLIRQAIPDDLATLHKLAKLVQSNNLPADREYIRELITRSRQSFTGQRTERADLEFLFVLEDTDTANVIGTASIIGAMGGPGRPHLYLRVRKHEHYSEDLRGGQVHVTLQLESDESGPTEIGGLVVSPAYRRHPARLGSLLSLARFHFIGLHREQFGDRIIAEMMGALTPEKHTSLWEYLGRRFINLSYDEADRFNRHSKEFITSLYPEGEIYVSLLPPEARSLIGRVGPETAPALAMLERLGFRYLDQVDPFDGGPYLETTIDALDMVRDTRTATLGDPAGEFPLSGYVSGEGAAGFRAVRCRYADHGDRISIPADVAGLLGTQGGDTVGVTALGPVPTSTTSPAPGGAGSTTRR
ncbi:MAG: arginine N-succinyltransferase [Planctomycetota bacterium]|jgi:arginine N-succinyltransferase